MKIKNTHVASFAIAALMNVSVSYSATFDWTGAANSNFTEGGNWSQNSWDQWSDYRFGGTPTNASATINSYFGMNSISLVSGLTSDITINSSASNPVIMGVGVTGNSSALISIAADSRNLTINGDYISASAVTWDVGSGRTLTLNGPLNNWFNPAALIKNGAGTALLTAGNGYTGTTTINGGTLILQGGGGQGTNYNGGSIAINGASTLRITGERYNFSGDTIAFDSNGGGTINAIASGAGGMVFMGGNTFQTNGGAQNVISGTRIGAENQGLNLNGQTATFAVVSGTDAVSDLKITGTLWNGGNVIKTGNGILEMAADQQYVGTTTVSGGTLLINGNVSTSTLTTVQAGATIGGTGAIGALTVNNGGFINPGNSPGILTVNGDFTHQGTLVAEITGTTAGGQYDQLIVNGEIALSGALDLQISGTSSYQLNDTIFLILNDGADAINGTFSNYSEGATVGNFGGFDWMITYFANGDSLGAPSFIGGNDVALRAIPEPSAALLGGLGVLGLLRRRRR